MHLDMIGLGRMGADVVCVVYNRSAESVAVFAGGGIAPKKFSRPTSRRTGHPLSRRGCKRRRMGAGARILPDGRW